jgi:hypothetical protein
MADNRITIHDRVRALDYIEWLARENNRAAAWLAEHDFEDEADDLQDAAKIGMSVVGRMWRPLLPQLPPGRWENRQ